MSRSRFARLAAAALVGLSAGCSLSGNWCGQERPGLFSRIRGQAPTEYAVPADCGCNGGSPSAGPFLGTPPSAPIQPNVIMPGPRPPLTQPEVQESPGARPMPYDPQTQSRPNGKPANQVRSVLGG